MTDRFEHIIGQMNENIRKLREELVQNEHVLVVDDEEVASFILVRLLEGEGFRVSVVSHAKEGNEILKKVNTGLLILDKNLPGVSGIDFLRKVRETWKDMEFIVITRHANLDSALEAIDLGAVDYLLKPFENLDVLRTNVNNAVRSGIRRQLNQKVVEELTRVVNRCMEAGVGADDSARELVAGFEFRLKQFRTEIKNRVLWAGADLAYEKEMCNLLKSSGYNVDPIESITWINKMLNRSQYNMVIIEGEFPEVTTVELVQRVKQIQPDSEVLVISSDTSLDTALGAVRQGASGYVLRTVGGPDLILKKIEKLLSRQNEAVRYQHLIAELKELLENVVHNIEEAEHLQTTLSQISREQAELSEVAELDAGSRIFGGEEEYVGEYQAHHRILVVDDEEVILEVMQELLEAEEYEASLAKTAEEALEVLKKGRFSLVIADKNLPGMSGLDLIEKAKEIDEDIETMMITGYASTDSAITAMGQGVCSYLFKPFDDINQVRIQVLKALAQHEDRMNYKKKLNELLEEQKRLEQQFKNLQVELGKKEGKKPGPSS